MNGTVIARWASSTVGIRKPEQIVALIREGVDVLLQQTSIPYNTLRAIAAGVPGITNFDTGVVIATSYLLGWRDVPLRDLLESTFAIPAAVDNDVNLAALGESWTGIAANVDDFVFVAIGTGLGAGIFLHGRPLRGMGWTAGEIGYMLLPGTPEQPAERGKPGALEGLIGGEGIQAQWRALWSESSTSLPRNLTATQIFDHALTGDALAATILTQSAHALASAIYNISLILNCRLFVLGGGVGTHPALRGKTLGFLEVWGTRVQPELLPSSLGTDAQLLGAVRLALDAAEISTRSQAPLAAQG